MTGPWWLIVLAGLNGGDAAATMRNWAQPGAYENNPVARPFVSHGPALTVTYFAGATIAEEWAARRLEHRGHRKWALAVRIGSAAAASYGIGTSLERHIDLPEKRR